MSTPLNPADDEQIKRELREALLAVSCWACGAAVNEPCRVAHKDPHMWHVMRKRAAGVHLVPPSAVLRSLGVHPAQGRRRVPKGT